MHYRLFAATAFALSSTFAALAQTAPPPGDSVPLYRVTVVERTIKAVNYQYRSDPTQIDFRGTVLLPEAKGQAIVQSKAGRTEIDAKFDHLAAPTRYGHEYLTYVIWAVTPQGQAKNLGEVLAGHSDKASLHITTDLQAFGMIVTAEPFSAVRQPSDVVVMENEVRPDTIGQTEPVVAKYELLPRGNYTYTVPKDIVAAEGSGPKVSMDQYEALLQIYQAQNALQIAQAAGADRYAPDTYQKAMSELTTAQQLRDSKADRNRIVMAAREAAETAEDARTIALKHKQEEDVALARDQVSQEQARRIAAEAEAQRIRAEASADRMQLDQERIARQQAEAAAARAAAEQTAAPPPPPPAVTTRPAMSDTQQKVAVRTNIYQNLSNSGLRTIDSPRGLVVIVPSAGPSDGLTRVAAIVAAHPGLMVEVSGNCDTNTPDQERMWRQRQDEVRDALVRAGVPPQSVTTRYYGASRPLASNATAAGREQNRRLEVTITGESIGTLPYWDKTYSVAPRQ